jgi:deoxyadenosine/deoxycytidine kinase
MSSLLIGTNNQMTWRNLICLKIFLVADYHIFKSLILPRLTSKMNTACIATYLISFTEKCQARFIRLFISKFRAPVAKHQERGRSYEQKIPAEYLDKINMVILDYIKSQTDLNVLIIDV